MSFEQQFGIGTERRMELYQQFADWLHALQGTAQLRKVWVFGSFVTQKPGPGDLDLVALFATGFNADSVAATLQHWVDHELCLQLHEIDLFVLTETTSAELRTLVLETFGRSRDGQESIVEVLL